MAGTSLVSIRDIKEIKGVQQMEDLAIFILVQELLFPM